MKDEKLNRRDVENLAQDANVENKSNVARKVGAYYSGSSIPPQAAKLAEDIFRIMVHDTEIKVREALSDSLKHCADLPQDVVTAIINDKDSVAVPFLQYYVSLTNEDLIKILNMPGINRQKAVAKRSGLSAEVSQYIAERCPDEKTTTLNNAWFIAPSSRPLSLRKSSTNYPINSKLILCCITICPKIW